MLAVVGVVAVAIIVIAVRYGQLGGPPPAALPSDAPPQGVDLIYGLNPGHPHGLLAYDWNGARRGSVTFPTWVDTSQLRPAPNGSAFMLDPASADDYAAYFDGYGRTVFETNEPGFVSQAWADDSSHVCVYTAAGDVLTRVPGQPDHVAHTRLAGQFTVVACSVRADTAILASSDQVEIVRLSSGATLRGVGLATGGTALGSTDASLVVLNAPNDVYRASDLTSRIAELGNAVNPLAFSGDDSLVLVTDVDGVLEAVDWRSGRLAWRYVGQVAQVAFALARPSDGDFIAYFTNATPVVIHSDGKVTRLVG